MVYVAIAGVGLAACLLADPGPLLPTPPNQPPFIDDLTVQPQPGVILTALPVTFTVPITRVDTTREYVWKLFIDYDPLSGTSANDVSYANSSSGATDDPSVSFQVVPLDVTTAGCHVFQFIAAYDFVGNSDRAGHTPVDPGGASVTWFYSPGGDLAGCPAYTGELDASFPDAGSDAGEAGTE